MPCRRKGVIVATLSNSLWRVRECFGSFFMMQEQPLLPEEFLEGSEWRRLLALTDGTRPLFRWQQLRIAAKRFTTTSKDPNTGWNGRTILQPVCD